MTKISTLAIVSMIGLGLAAAVSPASAATIASCQDSVYTPPSDSNGVAQSQIDQESASIIAGLRQQGVQVQDISDWGGCVKADVVRHNGTIAQEFFDPNTVQRLHVNG